MREVWEVVSDPHHLPRWWPRVSRVEGVQEDAFTEVLVGAKGKTMRADFAVSELVAAERVVWTQQLAGTPFAGVLRRAETEVALAARGGAVTAVTIALRQDLAAPRLFGLGLGLGVLFSKGFDVSRAGGRMVRKAAEQTVEEALDGLERVFGAAHDDSLREGGPRGEDATRAAHDAAAAQAAFGDGG